MTNLMLWGCMLLAYGPPAAFFLLYVGRRSALLLACLTSSIFQWAALLCTSLLWWAVPPLRGQASYPLIVGVLFTEIFRFALLHLYARADSLVERLGRPQRPRRGQRGKRRLQCRRAARQRTRVLPRHRAPRSAGRPWESGRR